MTIEGWNIRGAKSSSAVHALQDVLRQNKPDVLFFPKTHLSKAKAENLRRKCGFNNMLVDKSYGQNGGLVLMWQAAI
jgi:exonuclease III